MQGGCNYRHTSPIREDDRHRPKDNKATTFYYFPKRAGWAFATDPASSWWAAFPSHRSQILNFKHTVAAAYSSSCCTHISKLSFFPLKSFIVLSPAQPFFPAGFHSSDRGWWWWAKQARGLINPFLLPPPSLPLPLCSPLLPAWKANMGNLWKKVARESHSVRLLSHWSHINRESILEKYGTNMGQIWDKLIDLDKKARTLKTEEEN